MMPPPPDNEFKDPHLKDAVRRCWACDCAPKDLQKQIAGMLARSESRSVKMDRPLGRFSWFLWPAAIAASLLLGVGLFHQYQNRSASLGIATALPLPVALEDDLIKRHDSCSKLPDHQHLRVAKNDDAAIAQAMRQKLNRSVLVYHPADTNWQFKGAAICSVGSTPSGHLVFVKGNQALSIFSLPESMVPDPVEGTQYVANYKQHCIVGFIKAGSFFCAVSSGPADAISVDQLKKMEVGMEPAVAAAHVGNSSAADPSTASPSTVVLAELLRPIHQ